MKKMMMLVVAAMMMSATAVAQDDNGQKGEKPKFDKTEIVQRRTDGFAKRYGLDDKQKTKLLKLNTEYADKLPMGGPRHGMRPGGPRFRGDSLQARPQRPQNGGQPQMGEPRPDGAQMNGQRPDREQMKANMEAYDKQLKKILTDEQYKKYESDRSKMRKGRPEGQPREKSETEVKD